MAHKYCIAETLEQGKKSQFIAGPFDSILAAVKEGVDGMLFVMEEGKEPRFIDLDSDETQIL